ncbi:MAG: energy-coupling factor ABC transporter permease [Candidatus Bathyarchaeia archaeon]
MHIPDGFLDPYLCVLMYIISLVSLTWAWRGVRRTFPRSLVPVIAVSSAFVFGAQMLNFPIVYGTSGHLVGGTFLAMLLGPHAAVVSMSIVLLIQAIFFADGGISTFGANIFNMAVIGGLSFYIVKLLSGPSSSQKELSTSVFTASWFSIVLGALACAIQIGVSPIFASAGGVMVTVPAMLFWHIIIGIGEAAITTSLVSQLSRISPTVLSGLTMLRGVTYERRY